MAEETVMEPVEKPPQLKRPVSLDFPISAEFGRKGMLWKQGWHTGVDFACPVESRVYASCDGICSKSHDVGDDFGYYIRIDHFWHGLHFKTYYAHLYRAFITPGKEVSTGQIIAESGNSGKSTAPHLHFGVKVFNEWVKPNFYDEVKTG